MPETCSATRGAGNNRAFEVVVLIRYTNHALIINVDFLLSNVQISVFNPFLDFEILCKTPIWPGRSQCQNPGRTTRQAPFPLFQTTLFVHLRSWSIHFHERRKKLQLISITTIQRWNPTCPKTSAMMRLEYSAAPSLTRPPSKMPSTRWVYFCLWFWFDCCFCQLCRWTKKRSVRWRQGSRASGSRQARHVLHICHIQGKDTKSWLFGNRPDYNKICQKSITK